MSDVREELATTAPPDPGARNVAPLDLTRTYEDERIRVHWFSGRCIHSGACIRAAPAVFDPGRRPWVDLSSAEADVIARAVERCPTGALQYERLDGGPPEKVPDTTSVTSVRHGPVLLRGPVEVRTERGMVLRTGTRVALCRCGQSRHFPFCDNTHRAAGFRTPPDADG